MLIELRYLSDRNGVRSTYVRYCFADPVGAEIFRSRFEIKSEPFRLAC